MNVFLSSTSRDLEAYRAAVIARLRRLDGVEVRCMEDFGARAGSPLEYSLREARGCDLFIGVVGHLYGFVCEGEERSITEQEYDAAADAGCDQLIFVAPESFPVPANLFRGDSDPARQEVFRTRVLSRNVADLDWSSPDRLAAGVVAALRNWERARVAGQTGAALAGEIDLETYARRCRKRWEAVDLSALAAPGALDGDVDPPRLAQVFIPQACRRTRPATSLPRDYLLSQGLDPDEEERLDELMNRWVREERLPALDLLALPEARRLVLLGDPGAGKSSLARFVLLCLVGSPGDGGDPGGEWHRALHGHWPVLVELRDLLAREAEGRCSDLLSYLGYVGETQGFGFGRAAVEAQLRRRPSLVIVDGLDEIFSVARRRAMVEEIVGLETRFPLARVLVTSRIAGFHARPFKEAGFEIATLDDLDDAQIELFARQWFTLAFAGDAAKAEQARVDLLDTLDRRPQLAAIAGNPLILTIMAIIARHRRLARSRTQLYAQALEVLCYVWDYRRGLSLAPDSPLADLQPDDTLLLLRRVACHMQESGKGLRANAIGVAELRHILTGFFEGEWRFSPPRARTAATEMIGLLQERNWVLTLRGPDLYGFVHRTFLEYLCALEVAKRFEAQELTVEQIRDEHVLRHADDDSYGEVIRLLCGQLPVRTAEALIAALCPAPEQAIEHEHRLLLAWQGLGELKPSALHTVAGTCRAALLALAWRVRHRGWQHSDRLADLTQAISMIEPGSWPAHSVPATAPGCSSNPAASEDALLGALAKAIWLPAPALRERLFDMTRADRWAERRGALVMLSADRSCAPQLYEVLKHAAIHDISPGVRTAAFEILARGFAEWPETFNLLRQRIAGATVRELTEALELLVHTYPERPEMLAALAERRGIGHYLKSPAIKLLGEKHGHRVDLLDRIFASGGPRTPPG
ncbi:MAG TPA: DUF4062 domain-containing protein [Longimicrobium sp.]|nr:DUF4062 domain-containing protein [Longimicrobium sp.]